MESQAYQCSQPYCPLMHAVSQPIEISRFAPGILWNQERVNSNGGTVDRHILQLANSAS
jgi:hypothetical protein